MASLSRLGSKFLGKAFAIVLNLLPLTSMPPGLWITAKCSSSNKTFSGSISCFVEFFDGTIVSVMVSPPLMNVAEEANLPFTVIASLLSAFFKADLVRPNSKMPTPYS